MFDIRDCFFLRCWIGATYNIIVFKLTMSHTQDVLIITPKSLSVLFRAHFYTVGKSEIYTVSKSTETLKVCTVFNQVSSPSSLFPPDFFSHRYKISQTNCYGVFGIWWIVVMAGRSTLRIDLSIYSVRGIATNKHEGLHCTLVICPLAYFKL